MKRVTFLLLLTALLLCGCGIQFRDPLPSEVVPTYPSTTAPTQESSTPPTEESTVPTEAPTQAPTEAPTQAPTQPPIQTGWTESNSHRFYLDETGTPVTGWQALEGKRYYFNDLGILQTGWLTTDSGRFYLKEDGSMARGEVKIDGVNHFFTSTGAELVVVNPWNYVPKDYEMDLVKLSTSIAVSGMKVDRSCYDALVEMIKDCNKKSGAKVCVLSSYRSIERQTTNYNNKVQYWMNKGYSKSDAKAKAATSVAVPGTSEHHLGLAVDIIDTRLWKLTSDQEKLSGQKWLMKNCWKYGFILRYPKGTTDITGIIYEPWHYRYVGKELAAEIHELGGITLEEYFASLS